MKISKTGLLLGLIVSATALHAEGSKESPRVGERMNSCLENESCLSQFLMTAPATAEALMFKTLHEELRQVNAKLNQLMLPRANNADAHGNQKNADWFPRIMPSY